MSSIRVLGVHIYLFLHKSDSFSRFLPIQQHKCQDFFSEVVSMLLSRVVFGTLLTFFQQTMQISSNILDKNNKDQWDEIQKVRLLA